MVGNNGCRALACRLVREMGLVLLNILYPQSATLLAPGSV